MKQRRASGHRHHALTEAPPTRVAVNGTSGETGTIRVVVVSRQRLFSEALSILLGCETGIEIVGATAQEGGALELVQDTRPNIVLIDTPTPGPEDLDLLRTIRSACPDAKMLLLTRTRDEALICKALTAGARGYISKEAGISDLRKAIRGVYDGDVWVERRVLLRWLPGRVSAEAMEDGASARMKASLTAREQEILLHLASGGTNKEIAHALLISDKTVKTHLNNIFRKLQVTRRLQAVLYAVNQGLR
jgi:DNA-binding NarL/FixJ family response regulator